MRYLLLIPLTIFLATQAFASAEPALCANIAETFTSHLIRVEGGEVLDYGSTYC